MKIGIIGMGAIGEYISSMLSKNNEEVYVIAKGEALKKLKKDGIVLDNNENEKLSVFPTLITDNAEEAGIMDIVFICVKGYSLKAAAKAIEKMVHEHTLVIPIVNGVDIGYKLFSYLRKGKILDAAMYTSSKVVNDRKEIIKSNKIVISTNKNRPVYKIYLELIYNVLTKAGMICEIKKDVEVFAWNKYVFNCAFNITDSYYDVGVKGILEDKMKFETFCNVAKECEEVGRSKGIKLAENIYEVSIETLKKLSKKSISSMHRDVISGRKFELELFCGDLCRMGKAVGVPTPYTQKAYEKLKILQAAN
jgi:2-dehydropantoate 2-reductase